MKRLSRTLSNVIVALSLLACAAVAVAWVRSHHLFEDVIWNYPPDGQLTAGYSRGVFILTWNRMTAPSTRPAAPTAAPAQAARALEFQHRAPPLDYADANDVPGWKLPGPVH